MTRFHNYRLGMLALALLLVMSAPALASQIDGKIAMIDPDNYTMILVDNNNNVVNVRFQVGGEVTINEQERTFWDLQPGDDVTVTYNLVDEGELLATAVRCFQAE